ncbi:MAG: type II toxin-antitoxin system HicA family toxin [Candidatus Diapherotrites archaeon]
MARLPALSWRKIVKIVATRGFEFDHQRGSHMAFRRNDGRMVTIPRHDTIDRRTLKSILKQAEISRQEFERLVEGV